MIKSNHLRKVEKLIEIRSEVMRIVGLLEAIEETIRLWRQTDKLEEYWDYCWSNDSEIREHASRIKTCATQAHCLLVGFDRIPWMSDPEFSERWLAAKGSGHFNRVLTVWGGKQEISRLQPLARTLSFDISHLIETCWKSWRRKGSIWTHEQADFLHQELLELEYEMERAWSRIIETTVQEPHPLSNALAR